MQLRASTGTSCLLAWMLEGLFWLQGLRPETIFGCLHEYLFEPLPEVKEMFHKELALMQDSTLKIAIQV